MHLKLFHLPFESASFSLTFLSFLPLFLLFSLVIPDRPSYLLVGIICSLYYPDQTLFTP